MDKEHTRAVPLNGNAEVLLGLPLVSGAIGGVGVPTLGSAEVRLGSAVPSGALAFPPWECQPEKPYRLLKRLANLLPARGRRFLAE